MLSIAPSKARFHPTKLGTVTLTLSLKPDMLEKSVKVKIKSNAFTSFTVVQKRKQLSKSWPQMEVSIIQKAVHEDDTKQVKLCVVASDLETGSIHKTIIPVVFSTKKKKKKASAFPKPMIELMRKNLSALPSDKLTTQELLQLKDLKTKCSESQWAFLTSLGKQAHLAMKKHKRKTQKQRKENDITNISQLDISKIDESPVRGSSSPMMLFSSPLASPRPPASPHQASTQPASPPIILQPNSPIILQPSINPPTQPIPSIQATPPSPPIEVSLKLPTILVHKASQDLESKQFGRAALKLQKALSHLRAQTTILSAPVRSLELECTMLLGDARRELLDFGPALDVLEEAAELARVCKSASLEEMCKQKVAEVLETCLNRPEEAWAWRGANADQNALVVSARLLACRRIVQGRSKQDTVFLLGEEEESRVEEEGVQGGFQEERERQMEGVEEETQEEVGKEEALEKEEVKVEKVETQDKVETQEEPEQVAIVPPPRQVLDSDWGLLCTYNNEEALVFLAESGVEAKSMNVQAFKTKIKQHFALTESHYLELYAFDLLLDDEWTGEDIELTQRSTKVRVKAIQLASLSDARQYLEQCLATLESTNEEQDMESVLEENARLKKEVEDLKGRLEVMTG